MSASAGPATAEPDGPAAALAAADELWLAEAVRLVHEDSQVDLRDYRPSTFRRQMQRRMGEVGAPTLEAYLQRLRSDVEEVRQLRHCVLVSVTWFFRDAAALAELAAVLQAQMRERGPDAPLRLWVPGCATGEDAYTLAMLVAEAREACGHRGTVRLFATDVDRGAIALARQGRYDEATLAAVSPERRQRFFEQAPGGASVLPALRDLCVFAEHDLLTHTGFAGLDLVLCRNVLIYFEARARDTVLGRLARALNVGGLLVLGPSESLTADDARFERLVTDARIYRRRSAVPERRWVPPPIWPALEHPARRAPPPVAADGRASAHLGMGMGMGLAAPESALQRLLLARDALPSALIDEHGRVLQLAGDTTAYLSLDGASNLLLPSLLRPELREPARALIALALAAQGHEQRSPSVQLSDLGRPLAVRLWAQQLEAEGPQAGPLVLSFERLDSGDGEGAPEASLAEDLAVAREQVHALSRMLEESEARRRSIDEDLQASAEELQASNEELQASNEELQASNEELLSLNEQLTAKGEELGELNELLLNIERSVHMALVVLDSQLCVQRYNPLAVRLFGLLPADVGRPLASLHTGPLFERLPLLLAAVARDGEPLVQHLDHDERRYLLQVAPLRDRREAVGGMVVTLTDVTELRRAEIERARLAAIVAGSEDAIIGKTLDGVITSWNPGAERLFGYSAQEAIGQPMLIAFPDALRYQEGELLARVGRGETVPAFDTVRVHRSGLEMHVSVTLSPIRDGEGRIVGVSKIARDIGERVARDAERAHDLARLEELVNQRTLELSESRLFLESVLEDTPGFIAYWDPQLRLGLANAAQRQLLQALDSGGPEAALARLLHPALNAEHRAEVEAVQRGQAVSFEIGPVADVQGQPSHFSLSYRPLWRDGVVCGFVSLALDISPIRHAQAQATAANRAKSDFLAGVSHEIRTPLNAVLGLAQVGQRLPPGAAHGDIYERILHAGQHLLELINDVLDFSRIEAGKLELHPARVVLDDLLTRVVELVEQSARQKGLVLQLWRDPALASAYLGDGTRLAQILINLMINAVKFTDHGLVRLEALSEAGCVVFRVSDTGVGMEAALIARLFTPFERGDTSRTRRTGGTGLGLAICKHLVELMGGSIELDTRPGRGSTFTVRLHGLQAMKDPQPAVPLLGGPRGDAASQRLQGLHVLVAEDNPVNVLVLEQMLLLEGASFVTVADGQQALDLLAALPADARPFDLMLCDIEMPVLDGYETTRRLRARLPGLPVIGLTAHAFDDARRLGMEAGMSGYLTKPVLLDGLVAEMRRVLGR